MPPAGLVVLLVTIALPLTEIALLIKVGQAIGIWLLLAIILSTGALGAWVMQEQGMTGFRRMSDAVRQGRAPLETMMDGSLRFFAGLCLIAPGLITDSLGLLLLLPPVRAWAARAIHDSMVSGASGPPPRSDADPRPGRFEQAPPEEGRPPPRRDKGPPPVIEGDFERLDERPVDPRRDDRRGS